MVVTGVFGWTWLVSMSADGWSGTQSRVGAREKGRDGHGCPLWAETTHDSHRKRGRKVGESQRGRDEHGSHVCKHRTHNEA